MLKCTVCFAVIGTGILVNTRIILILSRLAVCQIQSLSWSKKVSNKEILVLFTKQIVPSIFIISKPRNLSFLISFLTDGYLNSLPHCHYQKTIYRGSNIVFKMFLFLFVSKSRLDLNCWFESADFHGTFNCCQLKVFTKNLEQKGLTALEYFLFCI